MATSIGENRWQGRSLESYKEMHEKTAKEKGVHEQFMRCKTLTQARKVLFGEKTKKYVARRDEPTKV